MNRDKEGKGTDNGAARGVARWRAPLATDPPGPYHRTLFALIELCKKIQATLFHLY